MVNIVEDYGCCNLCKKGKFIKIEEKKLSGTTYLVLKCEKCNHEVARSAK